MGTIKAKTYHAKAGEFERRWYIVDASGQTVGRLASRVAHVLRGKHKPQYTPSIDTGDFVVIINAEKAVFTGQKLEQKIYYRASTRPGHLKRHDAGTLMQNDPTRVLEEAVEGMLPHNTLGRAQARKLHVYKGDKHPHQAQLPQELDVVTLGVTAPPVKVRAEKAAKPAKAPAAKPPVEAATEKDSGAQAAATGAAQ